MDHDSAFEDDLISPGGEPRGRKYLAQSHRAKGGKWGLLGLWPISNP